MAPMIIAGPRVTQRGVKSSAYVTVADLVPTFLELARVGYPDDKAPLLGESAWPLLRGETESVHGPDYVTLISHAGRALLRQAHWKLVSIDLPFDERNFALYDSAMDPGETTDLSAVEPDKRAELPRIWRR